MQNPLGRIRSDLLSAARERATVTYGYLMKRHGLPRGQRLSRTIGEIDRIECDKGAPGFAAIIVRKDTGYPGGGYFCDDELPPRLRRPRKRSSDPRLSTEEVGYVTKQQRRIWAYYGKH